MLGNADDESSACGDNRIPLKRPGGISRDRAGVIAEGGRVAIDQFIEDGLASANFAVAGSRADDRVGKMDDRSAINLVLVRFVILVLQVFTKLDRVTLIRPVE